MSGKDFMQSQFWDTGTRSKVMEMLIISSSNSVFQTSGVHHHCLNWCMKAATEMWLHS